MSRSKSTLATWYIYIVKNTVEIPYQFFFGLSIEARRAARSRFAFVDERRTGPGSSSSSHAARWCACMALCQTSRGQPSGCSVDGAKAKAKASKSAAGGTVHACQGRRRTTAQQQHGDAHPPGPHRSGRRWDARGYMPVRLGLFG